MIKMEARNSKSTLIPRSTKDVDPLCPTLFSLFVDKLEYWIKKYGVGEICIICYAFLFLIYAKDVVLLTKQKESTKTSWCPKQIFNYSKMNINVNKIMVMVLGIWDRLSIRCRLSGWEKLCSPPPLQFKSHFVTCFLFSWANCSLLTQSWALKNLVYHEYYPWNERMYSIYFLMNEESGWP